jgi:hypothetical protein
MATRAAYLEPADRAFQFFAQSDGTHTPPVSAALRLKPQLPKDDGAVSAPTGPLAENFGDAKPIKYSPVGIVVLPPPQFEVLPAVMMEEQRYVAQAPNGVWGLPRIRHTGYRALGPFPKLPLRMPDGYLHMHGPQLPAPFQELRLGEWSETRQDLSGILALEAPQATRIHPADYVSWPEPKGVKLTRMLPERESHNAHGNERPIKRFGPGRAGLQARNRNADGQAKNRA